MDRTDRGRQRLKHDLDKNTDGKMDRQTEVETDLDDLCKKTDGWIDRQTEVETDLKVRSTKRQTDGWTEQTEVDRDLNMTWTKIQMEIWTDRQKDRDQNLLFAEF